MRGVSLPGAGRVDLREVPDPEPGRGQVVVGVRASTICGRDLRAIYREHLGEAPATWTPWTSRWSPTTAPTTGP